jgi:hypothetical protein
MGALYRRIDANAPCLRIQRFKEIQIDSPSLLYLLIYITHLAQYTLILLLTCSPLKRYPHGLNDPILVQNPKRTQLPVKFLWFHLKKYLTNTYSFFI